MLPKHAQQKSTPCSHAATSTPPNCILSKAASKKYILNSPPHPSSPEPTQAWHPLVGAIPCGRPRVIPHRRPLTIPCGRPRAMPCGRPLAIPHGPPLACPALHLNHTTIERE